MNSYHNTDKQIHEFLHEINTNLRLGGTMTEEEWEEMMVKWKCMDDEKKARFDKKCREYKKCSGATRTQIVHIAFDKALEGQEACNAMTVLLQAIKETNYEKTFDDPKARCEFYSKNGYNPHIHMFTFQRRPDSAVAQAIRKKIASVFKTYAKCPVYRVEVTNATGNSQLDYINGIKADEEKDEYMKQDDAFRQKYEMEETYNL